MKTQIIESVRKYKGSKLARMASNFEFKASKVVFADFLPDRSKGDWKEFDAKGFTGEQLVLLLRFVPCKEIWYKLPNVTGKRRIFIK